MYNVFNYRTKNFFKTIIHKLVQLMQLKITRGRLSIVTWQKIIIIEKNSNYKNYYATML